MFQHKFIVIVYSKEDEADILRVLNKHDVDYTKPEDCRANGGRFICTVPSNSKVGWDTHEQQVEFLDLIWEELKNIGCYCDKAYISFGEYDPEIKQWFDE